MPHVCRGTSIRMTCLTLVSITSCQNNESVDQDPLVSLTSDSPNPKTQNPIPKPQTSHPKPQTQNPKPQTPNLTLKNPKQEIIINIHNINVHP